MNHTEPADTQPWTIARILLWTQNYFDKKAIDSPRLDAELLLAHALGVNRLRLYTHYDQPLSQDERDAFRSLVKRRAGHEPVAYIRGHREFYGRDFAVNKAVLIPRPETEHLVEGALAWLKTHPLAAPRILDMGTGSGALAVTLAAECPQAHVTACDISAAALQVARQNAERHQVTERIDFVQSDLFEAVTGCFDVIVSNPPYVSQGEKSSLPVDVRDFEPAEALFAGSDGLDIIDKLCPLARAHLATPGIFLCEMGETHADAVHQRLAAAEALGWDHLGTLTDLQNHRRVAVARLGD